MSKRTAAVTTAFFSLFGISLGAWAQDQPAERSPGYVYSNVGPVVRDNTGHCVRTNEWTPDLATVECDPELVKRPVAVVQPAAPMAAFETISLETATLFDFDKAQLRPEGQQKLDQVISQIKSGERVGRIEVVGRADSTGPTAYNQGLSERRAASVKEYMAQNGVDPNLIETRGLGETQPIASNATREGRQLNRRVDVEVPVQRPVQR